MTEKQKFAVIQKLNKLENKVQDNISALKETCGGFSEGLTTVAGNKKITKVLDKADKLIVQLTDTLLDIDELLADNADYFLEKK